MTDILLLRRLNKDRVSAFLLIVLAFGAAGAGLTYRMARSPGWVPVAVRAAGLTWSGDVEVFWRRTELANRGLSAPIR
jgi:hypothetical protein